jgi:DNA-binding beta-propeller fold protein YncE
MQACDADVTALAAPSPIVISQLVGSSAGLRFPSGVTATPDGECVLVCDYGNRRVVVLNEDGTQRRELKNRQVKWPTAVACDVKTGQLLVVDQGRHQVAVLAGPADDTVVRWLGAGQGAGPLQLVNPFGIAILVDEECPIAVVADWGNDRLCLWRVHDGTWVRTLPVPIADGAARPKSSDPGRFDHPCGVAVIPAGLTGCADAFFAVADEHNRRLQLVTAAAGAVVRILAASGAIPLRQPLGVAVCVASRALVITDGTSGQVVIWPLCDDAPARLLPLPRGALVAPWGVAVLPDGRMWVADREQHAMFCFSEMTK